MGLALKNGTGRKRDCNFVFCPVFVSVPFLLKIPVLTISQQGLTRDSARPGSRSCFGRDAGVFRNPGTGPGRQAAANREIGRELPSCFFPFLRSPPGTKMTGNIVIFVKSRN